MSAIEDEAMQNDDLVRRLGYPLVYKKAYGSDFVHVLPTQMDMMLDERREAAAELTRLRERNAELEKERDDLIGALRVANDAMNRLNKVVAQFLEQRKDDSARIDALLDAMRASSESVVGKSVASDA
jgi:hypothetical protein